MHSVSEENYIKAIHHLQKDEVLVSTNDIAGKMNTKASSVTDMLKKLSDKGLVEYVPYKGSRLTKNGFDCAHQIVRKHRLWEVFLVEKLDFAWDEVHEVAEQLEHIQSQQLIDQLDKHLGFPKEDPHGDPIPDAQGNFKAVQKQPLSDCPVGKTAVLIAVEDSSSTFLKYLDKHGIELRCSIVIVEKEEYDGSMVININSKTLRISHDIASKLLVTV